MKILKLTPKNKHKSLIGHGQSDINLKHKCCIINSTIIVSEWFSSKGIVWKKRWGGKRHKIHITVFKKTSLSFSPYSIIMTSHLRNTNCKFNTVCYSPKWQARYTYWDLTGTIPSGTREEKQYRQWKSYLKGRFPWQTLQQSLGLVLAVHPQREDQVGYNPYFYHCCILHSNSQAWKNQSSGYSKHYKYSDHLGPVKLNVKIVLLNY